MTRRWKLLACVTLLATAVPTSVSLGGHPSAPGGGGPTIIYVDQSATGAGNGTSWFDAYVSVQVALTAADAGSQIWVAEGTYVPGIDRSSTFQLQNGVELYGGFLRGGSSMDNRDPWRHTTTLSGEIGNPDDRTDNCYHVLTGSRTDSTALLDGFQVTGGHASGEHDKAGGGMINTAGSPTIRNVIFLRNYAEYHGGAMSNWDSSPTLENVAFYGNRADATGGAVKNHSESHPSIHNALFVGNTAPGAAAVFNGDSSSSVLRNVTMVANEAEGGSSALYTDGTSSGTVMNSIVWGNSPHQIYVQADPSGTTSVYHTIVQDGCPINVACDNVIASDPLFLRSPSPSVALQGGLPPGTWGDEDDNYGDLRVESDSPAIDSGNNAMLVPGVFTDLMGNPRLVDGPADAIGAMGGGGATIDRGAYEAPPTPIYVDESASGTNNGTTWANALNNLQDAFLWGRSGVAEIWVAEGTYLPGDLRTSTFELLDRMTVYGSFPPGGGDGTLEARDRRSYRTVLSGDIGVALEPTDNVYHVVTASDVRGPVLDALDIQRGYADGVEPGQHVGAGLYAPSGHPELRNVVIKECYASGGGGGAAFSNSEARLVDTEFYNNWTDGLGGGLLLTNGGMFVIEDGYFTFNMAADQGGGIYAIRGNVYAYDTMFQMNGADHGAAVYLNAVNASLTRTRFLLNRANSRGGGMMAERAAAVSISNSLFTNNGADDGGALAADGGTLSLTNVTLSANFASNDGGGVHLAGSSSAASVNTILWGNLASGRGYQALVEGDSDLTSSHDLIEGGCPAAATCADIVKDDPLFWADPDAGDDGLWATDDDELGDLRLLKGSPAIDAGDNSVLPALGVDYALNPRRVDVASVADTGSGTAPVVDIGAYENPPDVIHVDQAAAGAYSGLTWTDAFTDVQDALVWGRSGPADVWVAQGAYVPGDERGDSFALRNRVSLFGGFPPGGGGGTFEVRDWRAYTTTLSGDIGLPDDRSDNAYHVLVARHVDQTVRVDGFVISGGSAEVDRRIHGGPSCIGGTDYGGGLCASDSAPILTNLVFKDNYAIKGGGVEFSKSRPTMANIAFLSNHAAQEGGGLRSDSSQLILINAAFAGNDAASSGGALWSDDSSLNALNVTMAGNHAGAGGAISNVSGTDVTLTNTILWANTTDAGPPVSSEADCTVAADYSLIEGGCPAGAACGHVLNSDPVFVRDPDSGADGVWGTEDDDRGDLRLAVTSPAIDAGDGDAFPGSITTDLLGNPRLVDVPAVPNTGSGASAIDMGAYEYVNTPPLAANDAYTTTNDAPLTVVAPGVLGNDSDPDGHVLEAVKDSDPTSGTLILEADGSFVYTPAPGATGVVTFTYHARDGYSASNVATVTITVTAGNVPPTISDISDQITNPGRPVGPIPFTIDDAETPPEALTLSADSSNTTLVPVESITFGGSGADRTISIVPTAGLMGTATITVTVHDGTDSASDTLVLTVETFRIYLPLTMRGANPAPSLAGGT